MTCDAPDKTNQHSMVPASTACHHHPLLQPQPSPGPTAAAQITGSITRIAAGTNLNCYSVVIIGARAHLHGAADGFEVDAGAGTDVRPMLLLPLRVLLLLLMMIPQAGSEGGTERLLLHLLLHSDGALRVWSRVPEQDVTQRQ